MKLKIWICVCFAVLTIFAGGCQSYEPSPLRIDSYRASLESRVLETEQLSAFVDRLDSMSDNISTQFDLSDGISPYEGEVLALVYNPDLRIARLEAGVALAEFNTAGLWQDWDTMVRIFHLLPLLMNFHSWAISQFRYRGG